MASRKTPEFSASSMADIAFLLLIFFLVTTTMDVDTGISRKLPPPLDPNVKPPDVKKRNICKILVNSHDMLLINGKPGELSDLKQETKEFLSNPNNLPNLPEKKIKNIEGLGEIPVSLGIISLKNDRGTSYNMYIQVQNELTAAVNELRDELSMQKFGVRFSKLTDDIKIKAIQKAVPVSISEAEPENIGDN
ncbi:MAG: biopolymer transporter ExbD [Bacteroidales bacterium]|nr:biopolymer transporter ExbD [Bacteroidales bacterium]